MIPCDYCQEPFEATRVGQRFCTTPGKNCRAAWHREHACPGKVTGLRALKRGWSVTVHYPSQPNGLQIGSIVRVETADIPRTDASTDKDAA